MPTLPFTGLTVGRFRGIRELTLEELGAVNILFGRNDSGKTSLLEAIALMCEPTRRANWIATAAIRNPFGEVIEPRPSQILWMFNQDGIENPQAPFTGTIAIRADGTVISKVVGASVSEVSRASRRSKAKKGEPRRVEFGARVKVSVREVGKSARKTSSHKFWDSPVFGNILERPSTRWKCIMPYQHTMGGASATRFSEVRLSGGIDRLVDALRSLDDRIRGLEVLTPRDQAALYVRTQSGAPVPLSEFGDGIRRAVSIALALQGLENGVLLIDEIETATHFSAIPKVFKWLVDLCGRLKIQLFVTTHSLEAIDGLLTAVNGKAKNIVGYHLDEPREANKVRRYAGDLLKRLRFEHGIDPR